MSRKKYDRLLRELSQLQKGQHNDGYCHYPQVLKITVLCNTHWGVTLTAIICPHQTQRLALKHRQCCALMHLFPSTFWICTQYNLNRNVTNLTNTWTLKMYIWQYVHIYLWSLTENLFKKRYEAKWVAKQKTNCSYEQSSNQEQCRW